MADDEDLDAFGGLLEFAEVAVDVLGVGEVVGGSDDVAEYFFGRGHGGGGGEMVYELVVRKASVVNSLILAA